MPDQALLIVDLQNDFCPGGALAVPEGDQVVAPANRLADAFGCVLQTQDWHPPGHHSFASEHPGKEPMETAQMDYGEQTLWPDHCVQGSEGARFHPDLDTRPTEAIFRKGFRPEIDSYSAFYENDHTTPTGLAGYLRERGTERLFLCGLAADFCVKWSVLDACAEGFETVVVEDATRGIDADGSLEAAWQEMAEAGATFARSEEALEAAG
ncbi:MAG: bifunctional nicotinamidase/pyrazinamidase [Bacteroidetes bacterium QS_9_68_14]|nr:MAG: bifunctional nicotinamidase/pyrazinamidase [Bacteroidetes bacterium QS_9_68_14]